MEGGWEEDGKKGGKEDGRSAVVEATFGWHNEEVISKFWVAGRQSFDQLVIKSLICLLWPLITEVMTAIVATSL